MRRLSCVDRVSSEKVERELGFSKKFNAPRKVIRDCNMVNHVSVPRKLRSAMIKRNRGSVSPSFPIKRKPNYAIDEIRSAVEEGKKKSRRRDDSEGSLSHPTVARITKDEEEAIETLFALAEMFPNDKKMNNLKCQSAEAKSMSFEEGESSRPAFEGPENEHYSQDILEVECPIEPLSNVNVKPCVSISCNFDSEPEITASIAAAVKNLQKRQCSDDYNKSSGLLPGMSSAVLLGTDVVGPSMNLSGAYSPIGAGLRASKAGLVSFGSDTKTEKDSRDPAVRNKSWNRCLTHAHISQLIKSLQKTEKTNKSLMQPQHQLITKGPNEEANFDTSVSRNGIGASASASAEKNLDEIRNAVLLQERLLLQDQHQPSPTHSPSKQSFDFLSLSTGSGGGEATTTRTASKTGWSQFHIPYLQSIAQNQTAIPLSLPQSHYSTTPYTDYFPATTAKQVQMEYQPYLSNTNLGPSQQGSPSSSIYHQQRIWAAQFVSQFKPMTFLNKQNGKQDPSNSVQFNRGQHSLELLHPMYIPIPQQGHNLIPAVSSLTNSRAKRPALPLQLLCNEHI